MLVYGGGRGRDLLVLIRRRQNGKDERWQKDSGGPPTLSRATKRQARTCKRVPQVDP